MPTISATFVRRSVRPRWCAECRKQITGGLVRLYGYGCEGDPPYVMRICMECAGSSECAKVKAALEGGGA